MRIVVDTSAVIAVIAGEPEREILLDRTQGADLLAPESLHWELGNALAGQLRRNRLHLSDAREFIRRYLQIPIQFVEVALEAGLEIAAELGIYAYDAYMVACARKYRCPLITLDRGLQRAAGEADVEIVEVR